MINDNLQLPKDREMVWDLIKQFDQQSAYLSSMADKTPAFQELLAIGSVIVPILAQAVNEGYDFRLTYLMSLLVDDPPKIEEKDYGIVEIIREAWLEWSRDKGYIA